MQHLFQGGRVRFIPSCEGQTIVLIFTNLLSSIHPLLRGADCVQLLRVPLALDSSPPASGRQLKNRAGREDYPIHPLLRGADNNIKQIGSMAFDSSPLTKGRHSVLMRLSAALNTSLCNLHKCHSCLIRIFNMPKNPPHFHFF